MKGAARRGRRPWRRPAPATPDATFECSSYAHANARSPSELGGTPAGAPATYYSSRSIARFFAPRVTTQRARRQGSFGRRLIIEEVGG